MKKLLILTAALCLLGLTACGTQTDEGQQTDDQQQTTAQRVEPMGGTLDPNDLTNATAAVTFTADGVHTDTDPATIDVAIYDYDLYDVVEVANLAEGDTVVVDGKDIVVTSVEMSSENYVTVNGGVEEGGVVFAPGEGGTYYLMGMDDAKDYHQIAALILPISADVVVKDSAEDPDEANAKTLTLADVAGLAGDVYGVSANNTHVVISDGTVTEIARTYVP